MNVRIYLSYTRLTLKNTREKRTRTRTVLIVIKEKKKVDLGTNKGFIGMSVIYKHIT